MCLIQGGAAIRNFCPSIISLMYGMNPSDIVPQIEEIPDKEVQDKKTLFQCIVEFGLL